jgi:hypothetical protein
LLYRFVQALDQLHRNTQSQTTLANIGLASPQAAEMLDQVYNDFKNFCSKREIDIQLLVPSFDSTTLILSDSNRDTVPFDFNLDSDSVGTTSFASFANNIGDLGDLGDVNTVFLNELAEMGDVADMTDFNGLDIPPHPANNEIDDLDLTMENELASAQFLLSPTNSSKKKKRYFI